MRLVIAQERYTVEISYELFENWDHFPSLSREVSQNDPLTVVLGRPHTVSCRDECTKIPRYLSRHFTDVNFVVLYPQQKG